LRLGALCRPLRPRTPWRSSQLGCRCAPLPLAPPGCASRSSSPGREWVARPQRPVWPASGCAGGDAFGVARREPWTGDRRSSSAHDRARRRSVRLGRSRTLGRCATRPANAGPACDSAALWRPVNDDPARCGENFGRNLKRLGSFEVVDKTLNVRTRTGRDIARRSIEKRTSSGLDFRKDSIYTSWQCFTGGCAPLGCRPPFAPQHRRHGNP
jgi:hypothetical protein